MKNPILTLLGALVVLAMAANSAYAAPTTEKGPRCSDSIDNDGDGLIDADDPDCGGTNSEPRLVVVDSTGQVVGPVLTINDIRGVADEVSVSAEVALEGSAGTSIVWIGFSGYGVAVGGTLYFSDPDCLGTPHIVYGPYFPSFRGDPGAIIPTDSNNAGGVVYVANGPASVGFIPQGFIGRVDGACNATNTTFGPGTEVYPVESLGSFYALFPPPYDVIEQ